MTSLNNESEDSSVKGAEVKEIINKVIDDLDPQEIKAILEKNKEYQQVMHNLIIDIKKRIEELEELKQRKLELLASL